MDGPPDKTNTLQGEQARKENKMRESTFANIGNDITANTKMVEGLPEDFCFTVSKKPLGFLDDNGNFNQVKGHSTVVRDDNGKSYGAVSDKYQTVDNLEALGSVQYMDGLTLRKYGETHTMTQYNKDTRTTIYLADLKEQPFGPAGSAPAPASNDEEDIPF